MDHAIGAVCSRSYHVFYSVVLPAGELQPFVVKQQRDEEELIKAHLLEQYPDCELIPNEYAFRKACKEIGENDKWVLPKDDGLPPRPPQKFQLWEWVEWAGMRYIITDVTTHRLTYQYGMRSEIRDTYASHYEDDLEKVDPQPPIETEVTLDIPGKVGDIISWHGHDYRVVETSYISAREAADLEDGFDIFDAQGYHTRAVLIVKKEEE